jgi:hypothetical protein
LSRLDLLTKQFEEREIAGCQLPPRSALALLPTPDAQPVNTEFRRDAFLGNPRGLAYCARQWRGWKPSRRANLFDQSCAHENFLNYVGYIPED